MNLMQLVWVVILLNRPISSFSRIGISVIQMSYSAIQYEWLRILKCVIQRSDILRSLLPSNFQLFNLQYVSNDPILPY